MTPRPDMPQEDRLAAQISALKNLHNLLCKFENEFSIEDLNVATKGPDATMSTFRDDMITFKVRVVNRIKDVEDSRSSLNDESSYLKRALQPQSGDESMKMESPLNEEKMPVKRQRLSEDSPDLAMASDPDRYSKRRRPIQNTSFDGRTSALQNSRVQSTIESHPESTTAFHVSPAVEYDDIAAEVAERLRANEERRRRNANGETNPSVKRKRESVASAASWESWRRSFDVSIKAAEEDSSGGTQGRKRKRIRSVLNQVAANPQSRATTCQSSVSSDIKRERRKARVYHQLDTRTVQ